jgi:hypothetical protein
MNSKTFSDEAPMKYVKVKPEVWAERYNLPFEPMTCAKCGRQSLPLRPFKMGRWRGLRVETHECGEDFAGMVMAHLDDRPKWAKLVSDLKESMSDVGDVLCTAIAFSSDDDCDA